MHAAAPGIRVDIVGTCGARSAALHTGRPGSGGGSVIIIIICGGSSVQPDSPAAVKAKGRARQVRPIR